MGGQIGQLAAVKSGEVLCCLIKSSGDSQAAAVGKTGMLHGRMSYMGENIIISGLTAAGKTTHCHLLAGEFNLQYVSASQVLLSLLHKCPVQARDFWGSAEGRAAWSSPEALQVDELLLRIEADRRGLVFDTLMMPWVHRRAAFVIWLESSLPSRVMKSIASHRGENRLSKNEAQQRIEHKDDSARALAKARWGIDIAEDRGGLDLILNISACIKTPTMAGTMVSIRRSHAFVHAAVGWYLTGDDAMRVKFQEAKAAYPEVEVIQCPPELLRRA